MNPQFLKFRRCGGFSFLEALVVVGLFTGFIVSTSGVFLMAFRAQSGSYHQELSEQANMRAAFELEYLFRSSLGVSPLRLSGGDYVTDLSLTQFDAVSLTVPNHVTGISEAWQFRFVPTGEDSSGRIQGNLSLQVPGSSGGVFVGVTGVVLPEGQGRLFSVDELGRVRYHWVVPAEDADLSWSGILVSTQ